MSPSAVLNQSGRILVLSLSSLDHSTRADSIMGDWVGCFLVIILDIIIEMLGIHTYKLKKL